MVVVVSGSFAGVVSANFKLDCLGTARSLCSHCEFSCRERSTVVTVCGNANEALWSGTTVLLMGESVFVVVVDMLASCGGDDCFLQLSFLTVFCPEFEKD